MGARTPAVPAVMAVAVIAALEAAALLAYAVYALVEGFREGFTGPAEVSSVPSRILLVVVLAALGVGMAWVAVGWWRVRRWARAPFLMSQILAGLLGYELAQATGSLERYVGIALMAVGVIGIVLVFTPPVSRALADQ